MVNNKMEMQREQPLYIYFLCFAASFVLNFFLVQNFKIIARSSPLAYRAPLVEVNLELSPDAEELEQMREIALKEAEKDFEEENLKVTEWIKKTFGFEKKGEFAKVEPAVPDRAEQISAQASIPGKAVVDKSDTFSPEHSAGLSAFTNIEGLTQSRSHGFETIEVEPGRKGDMTDTVLVGTARAVSDKGSDFKKEEYAALPNVGVKQKESSYESSAGLHRSGIGTGRGDWDYQVTSSMVEAVKKRDVVYKVQPEYPQWAKKLGIEAVVVLRFSILPDGRVSDKVYALQTSGYADLDAIAIKALKEWMFSPSAVSEGEEWGKIAFSFKLQ